MTTDEIAAELDRASAPLRNAVSAWARAYGLGSCSGWYEIARLWRFEIFRADITVEILEDGSEARVIAKGETIVAKTVRGLSRVLNKAYEG